MSTFVLKRKTFSDNNQDSGGLGKKVVAGTALAAGTFLGAKKGLFGGIGRMAAGKAQMGVGNLIKNKGLYAGGAKSYGKGYASEVNKTSLGGRLNKNQLNKAAVITKNNLMRNFKGNSKTISGNESTIPVKLY